MIAPPNATGASSAAAAGGQHGRTQAVHSDGDSDSDWEDDDDFVSKRINIKIKPIAQMTPSKISASVDELRATVGTWKSMADINLVKPNSRRSQYQSTAQLDKLAADEADDTLHLTFGNKLSLAASGGPTVAAPTLNENNNLEILGDFGQLGAPPARAPPPPPPPSRMLDEQANFAMPDFLTPAGAAPSISLSEHLQQHPRHLDGQMPVMQMTMIQPQSLAAAADDTFTPLKLESRTSTNMADQNYNSHQINNNNNMNSYQHNDNNNHHHHHHHQQQLPVALALQECLNVRGLLGAGGPGACELVGHLKMAVPWRIIELGAGYFANNNLTLRLSSPRVWSTNIVSNNNQFIVSSLSEVTPSRSDASSQHDDDDENQHHPLASTPLHCFENHTRLLVVDMAAVYAHAKDMYQRQPDSAYFLLPELLTYSVKSHPWPGSDQTNNDHETQQQQQQHDSMSLNPIEPQAHWLCDLSATKVRVDMEFLEERLAACGLEPRDVRNVKLAVQVDGGAVAQRSKPAAQWSQLDSRLTWAFGDLGELMRSSTTPEGVTSCLAKLDLTDGPSTPSALDFQFSIAGKALSGTHVSVVQDAAAGDSYRLAKLKSETRTGSFTCEPPMHDSSLSLSQSS